MDASIELKDSLISCSAGLLGAGGISTVIDMNLAEEQNCKGNFILVYSPNKQKVALMDLANSKLPGEQFAELLDMAEKGCRQIGELMRQHLLIHYVSKLVTSH